MGPAPIANNGQALPHGHSFYRVGPLSFYGQIIVGPLAMLRLESP